MCYTIQINLTREQIEKRFKAQFDKNHVFRKGKVITAFGFPKVPAICKEQSHQIVTPVWGLIPSWVKGSANANSIRTKTFNAKVETIGEKPSFRHLVGQKHCIVITSGFYEWQHRGNAKQPYFIHSSEDEFLPLAGLYDDWSDDKTGELMRTFSVLTTQANKLMQTIHNTQQRMPLILSQETEEEWLKLSDKQEIDAFIKKYAKAEFLQAIEVDPALFSRKSDDGQQRLF